MVETRPDLYLDELQHWFHKVSGKNVTIQTICNHLLRMGFTHKKLSIIAIERDEFERAHFARFISLFPSSMFLFVDECSKDDCDYNRRYGHFPRGRRHTGVLGNFIRKHRISVLAGLDINGKCGVHVVDSSYNEDLFNFSFRHAILPHVGSFVRFGGQLFSQMVGIPMGTNCAPLLADLFLYSYENEFLDKLIKEGKRKLARRFNLSYRYIDDLISFNNKRFKEFTSDIYPKELTISETTESTSVASYLDLLFTRDRSNNITTKLYDKRDAFGFHIVNFPFMSSNIPSAPAYGVYASQLICYARCCSSYSDFFNTPQGPCEKTSVTGLQS